MYQRPHYQQLEKRLSEPRSFIQVILGPRQVGKTTLVKQFLENYKGTFHYASADAVPNADSIWLQQQWELARLRYKKEEGDFLLVIDEVQKLLNWSEKVKALWDDDTFKEREIKVVLLGSSRLLLQKGLTESLAGRFETTYMNHWGLAEMQEAFGWNAEQFVWFGGYPGAAQLIEDEDRWKQYVLHSLIETSISKDVLMLSRIDKPMLMRQLFELGCLYSGQILSLNKIIGQLQDAGNTTTMSHYLNLLDSASLLGGLQKYSPGIIRKRASSPKFQVYNNALLSAQHPDYFNQVRQNLPLWGRWVESAIGSHLINHTHEGGYQLQYWRERNDEVDFVISKGNRVVALEIKSGKGRQTVGMHAFSKKYPAAKVLLISENSLSWEDFLKIDPTTLF